MKIPKFRNEAEEADWLYAHRKQIEAEILKEQPKKTLSVQQIIEREATRAISIRLPVADIERAKEQAKEKGIGYQTLIRMVVHENLRGAFAGKVAARKSFPAARAAKLVRGRGKRGGARLKPS